MQDPLGKTPSCTQASLSRLLLLATKPSPVRSLYICKSVMPRSGKSNLNSSYLAGVMRSSSRVAPGMGAVAAASCLAFSRILSLVLEAKSSVVTIALGAIPNSLRS